ncbi:phytoene desaturase family protein [Rhodohalobacter mucosus]|uniref:Phytoene desaturase n=1 Tax=Rhodohalobacter mucosus TaxID=2079485 RepID=A0A316TV74_9BACT|nr:phytoene desaturase family protein [Rhodohalobacter mucosus]PWN07015.1 phytoene desaturase [Rhodohalobacter mucosus]
MSERAIVIGAGIGGLAAASLLASRGYSVDVYEKNGTPGGKMQQVHARGYRFDTGPSLFTMPFLLERLFSDCGRSMSDYLEIVEPEPLCRYFYKDGVRFDSYSDRKKAVSEIRTFAPGDTDAYVKFLDRAEEIYTKTSGAFIFNPLFELSDLKSLNLADFLNIDAFSTVSNVVDTYFDSPHLRQFFKRFATYNGSSPFRAPATLNVIPHVELNQGGYYVNGGLYQIAESMEKLAADLGVRFHYNKNVNRILAGSSGAEGVETEDGTVHKAEVVIANSDATDTILNLLPANAVSSLKRARQKKIEPSCSGFVLLLGCNRSWPELVHHNIFFSEDYRHEFEQIFGEKKMPGDPTIYIANTSHTNPEHAPDSGSNLFILVNAPYLHDSQNWDEITPAYADFLIDELESRGLNGLRNSVEFKETINPNDFFERYRSNRGSIYGTASNTRFSAFLRPRNKLRGIDRLYLVGGSTHPGGGIPLVIQSAFNAMELLDRE